MEGIVFALITLTAAAYYFFAEVGTNTYYFSIAAVVAVSLRWLGAKTALMFLLGFVGWHFTNFSSDSIIFYLFMPLLAGLGIIVACVSIPVVGSAFNAILSDPYVGVDSAAVSRGRGKFRFSEDDSHNGGDFPQETTVGESEPTQADPSDSELSVIEFSKAGLDLDDSSSAESSGTESSGTESNRAE